MKRKVLDVILYVLIVVIAIGITTAITVQRAEAAPMSYCQARAGVANLILESLSEGLPIERINVQMLPPGDAETEAVRAQWIDGLKAEVVATRAEHPGEADAQVAYRIFAACQSEQGKREGREVNAGGFVRTASSQAIADPQGGRVAMCKQRLNLEIETGNALASGMSADELRAIADEVADKVSPQRLAHIKAVIDAAATAHAESRLQAWFDAHWRACMGGA